MIQGTRIILRSLEPQDIDRLYQWENDQAIWHLSHTVAPFSRFDIEQYVLNTGKDIFADRQLRLMIDKKSDSTTIGVIDIFDFDPLHQRAGLGILIAEPDRENGYASEALQLVIEYCFSKLMLHQLFANITPDNLKSIRLFEKNGFELVGRKKDWLRIDNKWKDELLYQLLK
jgi:diamine N-acetyltransferase